jgi:hypothetical protein
LGVGKQQKKTYGRKQKYGNTTATSPRVELSKKRNTGVGNIKKRKSSNEKFINFSYNNSSSQRRDNAFDHQSAV